PSQALDRVPGRLPLPVRDIAFDDLTQRRKAARFTQREALPALPELLRPQAAAAQAPQQVPQRPDRLRRKIAREADLRRLKGPPPLLTAFYRREQPPAQPLRKAQLHRDSSTGLASSPLPSGRAPGATSRG